jgi:hypothetical protein
VSVTHGCYTRGQNDKLPISYLATRTRLFQLRFYGLPKPGGSKKLSRIAFVGVLITSRIRIGKGGKDI